MSVRPTRTAGRLSPPAASRRRPAPPPGPPPAPPPPPPPPSPPPPRTPHARSAGELRRRRSQNKEEGGGAGVAGDPRRGRTATPVLVTHAPAFRQHHDITHESPALPFITSCPFASLKRIPCVKLADI